MRRYDLHATKARGTGKDSRMEKPRDVLEGYRAIKVMQMLKRGWSPELIAGRIKTHHRDLPTISHEAIYQCIALPICPTTFDLI